MALLTPPAVVVSGTKILASKYNADISGIVSGVNANCFFLSVASTITGANSYSALQTFTAGVTLSGSSNLSVAGTSTLTGNTTVGGTLGVTGAVTLSSTLAVTGTITGNLTGNVTGNLTGNVTGNVSGSSGSCTGLAATATALATPRAINGVNFDGTAPITVTAAAGTLSGNTLASGVTLSSLTTLGTLAGHLLFTDATYDIGANGATRPRTGYFSTSVIAPLLNNTGNTITLRGVTYTLPSADGTSGQVLSTNGSGTLSWAAASAGFITGSGTSGKLTKFSGSAAVTDSSVFSEATTVGTVTGTLVVTGNTVSVGGSSTKTLRFRNNADNGWIAMVDLLGSDVISYGAGGYSVILGAAGQTTVVGGYYLPVSDGTAGQVLKTDGGRNLSWVTTAGSGISGLTTGTIPKAATSSTLADSIMAESAGQITITGLLTVTNNTLVSGTFTVGGNTSLNGNTTFGDATSDTLTFTSRAASHFIPSADGTYDLGSSSLAWRVVYGNSLKSGSTQLVGARVTGWTTPTATGAKTTGALDWSAMGGTDTSGSWAAGGYTMFDTLRSDTRTVAAFVKAIYDALVSHGLIGA